MDSNPNLYAPLRRPDEVQPWPDDIRRTGLDYQGRHPEAAHACTDIGQDEPAKLTRWQRFVRRWIIADYKGGSL